MITYSHCEQKDCPLCMVELGGGCQCTAKSGGCWFCLPRKWQRPMCPSFLKAERKKLFDTVGKAIEERVEEYGIYDKKLHPHIYERQNSILDAPTWEAASAIAEKLLTKSILLSAIHMWGVLGKGAGPPDKRNSVTKAEKAESLAKMLEKKGDVKGAESQLERARSIREAAGQTGA